MTIAWGRRLLPLLVTQAYLWLTLLMYFVGPWRWDMRNPATLYGFVIGAHVALLLGYLSVAHKAPAGPVERPRFDRLLRAGLWVNLVALPFTTYARTGNWVPDIVGAIRNPGQAYFDTQLLQSSGANNVGAYIRILLCPWLVVLFPLVVFGWGRIGRVTRILAVGLMGAIVLMSVATGQRRDIADLLITLPLIAAASHWAGVTRFSRQAIVRVWIGLSLAAIAFTAFFVYSHVSRLGREAAAYGTNLATKQLPDFDNPILQALPDSVKPGYLGIANYLATGYYGLSLTLDRDVKPMYGFGNSMFLTRNFAKITSQEDFENRSLPVQISQKDGFLYPVFWCTAYPYFANDLGWIGTIVMLFFVGQAFALAWIDMLGGKNPLAVVFFSLVAILIFYLPATNRMLQDGEGVVSFYAWLALWLVHRLRR